MRLILFGILAWSYGPSLFASQDPYVCQNSIPSQLGAQIMVIGDSNAQNIGQHIDHVWVDDTFPEFSNIFSDEKSMHISQLHNLATPATGLLFEFKHYEKFINNRQFTQRYSKERWSEVFKIELTNRTFAPGDLVIIWVGTNDNQNWNKLARQSPQWWEHYKSQVQDIAQTCVSKNLDCYWIGPARVIGSQTLRNFLDQLNQSLKIWLTEYSNISYLEIFNQFSSESFTQDGYHLNKSAERNIIKQLNAQISIRRGYNIEANTQAIRQCKKHLKKTK